VFPATLPDAKFPSCENTLVLRIEPQHNFAKARHVHLHSRFAFRFNLAMVAARTKDGSKPNRDQYISYLAGGAEERRLRIR